MTNTFVLILVSLVSVSSLAGDLTWRQLKTWVPGQDGPSDREHPTIWIDPVNTDSLHLFGGQDFSSPQESTNDFWSLDLNTENWKEGAQIGKIPGVFGRITTDTNTSEAYYYGGSRDGIASEKIFSVTVDTNNIATWKERPSSIPSFPGYPNMLHSLIYVPLAKLFVSFAGLSSGPHSYVFALWKDLSQMGWSILEPTDTQTPTGRYGFAYAFDEKKNRVFMTGGQPDAVIVNGVSTFVTSDETWTLDLSGLVQGKPETTWKKLEAPALPSRRNPCWAHDTDQNKFYVWGGTADGATSHPGLYRLDLNNEPEGWKLVTTVGTAPERSSCVGLYDAPRKRLLFGFGNTLNAAKTAILPHTDLWELKLE